MMERPRDPSSHVPYDTGSGLKRRYDPSKIERERDRLIEAFSVAIQDTINRHKLLPSAAEQAKIEPLVPSGFGLAGMSAACLTFVCLRYLPPIVGRLMANAASNLTAKKTSKGKSPRLSTWVRLAIAPRRTQVSSSSGSISSGTTTERLQYLTVLAIQYVIALGAAALVSALSVDDDPLYDAASQFPLYEGKRSPLVDHVCPKVMELWHQQVQRKAAPPLFSQEQQAQKPKHLLHQTLDTSLVTEFHQQVLDSSFQLRALQRGVQNCASRSAEEDRLREEQNLSPDQAVDIPSPGVGVVTESTAARLVEDAP